eukprot:gnl/TRDRNA2_/TRDRNA2_199930_c0_seq1.p1 gnl/TRDRNA2_/TRDRNA2_199930_c0~~gnl/TRDRNA2_/TRDRNA2_199930_c0_seq1.p1  ORF type:complete len:128 (+),score=17.47 gnl/TRDRNA2_/TRDRNA2_199930_c0_seq1:173-556(+)
MDEGRTASTASILRLGELEEDVGGPQALYVADNRMRLSIILNGPMGKVAKIKDIDDMHKRTIGGVVCSTKHYYSPGDSYAWGCEVGINGLVTILATAVHKDDPKRQIVEERWNVMLVDGSATSFEKV